ncbi:MAG: hypothetical protein FWC97_00105 [Treponema sp.]|nr:hypothetical protein [Treponema sp.]
MKKITALTFVLLFLCGTVLSAQDDWTPIQFQAYGQAIWAPLVFRAQGDLRDPSATDYQEGPGFGVAGGPGWENNINAAVGLRVFGNDRSGNIGFDFAIRAIPVIYGSDAGSFNIRLTDNTAFLWARPFGNDILRMQFGAYKWDNLAGQVGWLSGFGGFGGGYDDIFQSVESDIFGALFVLRPPHTVPNELRGLTLFGSFGVSGGLDGLNPENQTVERFFAARTRNALRNVFSTAHAGIAYELPDLALLRFQFIGGRYIWGRGEDWNDRQMFWPWYGTTTVVPSYWFPSRSQEATQLEFAANITAVPNLNLDIGFGYSMPVTVVMGDDGSTVRNIGPMWGERGHRAFLTQSMVPNDTVIANSVGDVWQPPMRISAGLDYRFDNMNLGFRFRTLVEFGETVSFYSGADDYVAGLRFDVGIEPWFDIPWLGTLSLGAALSVRQNDSFNGRGGVWTGQLTEYKIIHSVNHNGRIDLGFSAFLTRTFTPGNLIRVGVMANLPIGGDRFNWYSDNLTGLGPADVPFFSRERAEAFRKGNIIIAVPIIIELNL